MDGSSERVKQKAVTEESLVKDITVLLLNSEQIENSLLSASRDLLLLVIHEAYEAIPELNSISWDQMYCWDQDDKYFSVECDFFYNIGEELHYSSETSPVHKGSSFEGSSVLDDHLSRITDTLEYLHISTLGLFQIIGEGRITVTRDLEIQVDEFTN